MQSATGSSARWREYKRKRSNNQGRAAASFTARPAAPFPGTRNGCNTELSRRPAGARAALFRLESFERCTSTALHIKAPGCVKRHSPERVGMLNSTGWQVHEIQKRCTDIGNFFIIRPVLTNAPVRGELKAVGRKYSGQKAFAAPNGWRKGRPGSGERAAGWPAEVKRPQKAY